MMHMIIIKGFGTPVEIIISAKYYALLVTEINNHVQEPCIILVANYVGACITFEGFGGRLLFGQAK